MSVSLNAIFKIVECTVLIVWKCIKYIASVWINKLNGSKVLFCLDLESQFLHVFDSNIWSFKKRWVAVK